MKAMPLLCLQKIGICIIFTAKPQINSLAEGFLL